MITSHYRRMWLPMTKVSGFGGNVCYVAPLQADAEALLFKPTVGLISPVFGASTYKTRNDYRDDQEPGRPTGGLPRP